MLAGPSGYVCPAAFVTPPHWSAYVEVIWTCIEACAQQRCALSLVLCAADVLCPRPAGVPQAAPAEAAQGLPARHAGHGHASQWHAGGCHRCTHEGAALAPVQRPGPCGQEMLRACSACAPACNAGSEAPHPHEYMTWHSASTHYNHALLRPLSAPPPPASRASAWRWQAALCA